ncbi:MAG TPA: HAD family hydrolase [Pseudonocardiaceae bacterium]
MSAATLFDLDGTLLDTPSGIARAIHEVLAELGAPPAPEDRVRATIGRPLVGVFATLLGQPEDHRDVLHAAERFRVLFREQVVPTARDLVFPGVTALLADLRADGRALAVVTSKIRASAEELLTAAGLTEHFDAVVCHGMAERGKPHPDLALLAADRLSVAPEECVVVGDAVDDVRMAVAARMDAVGVGYGVAEPEQLRAAGARTVAATVAELREALGLAAPAPATTSVPSAAG